MPYDDYKDAEYAALGTPWRLGVTLCWLGLWGVILGIIWGLIDTFRGPFWASFLWPYLLVGGLFFFMVGLMIPRGSRLDMWGGEPLWERLRKLEEEHHKKYLDWDPDVFRGDWDDDFIGRN